MIRRRIIAFSGHLQWSVQRTLSHARQDDGAVYERCQHQACGDEPACCCLP